MKKLLLFAFAILFYGDVQAQNTHQLIKLWQTDSVIAVPESVLIDFKEKILFVSEIGPGDASQLDNNGGIGKLGMDGKLIELSWAKGLHSPKGLAKKGNELYVADLKELVVIDIKSAKITKRYP